MSLKRELVIHADIGLCGTFVRWVENTTEKGFRYLEYVPLNSFPPKKKTYPVAIHKDHIHVLHSTKGDAGVESRIVFIYTGESGSLIKEVLMNDSLKTIAELREKNRKLQMQVASSKQSEEDARSGVNKQIASMKQAQRGSSGGGSPFDSYGGGPPMHMPQRQYEYDDFDNY